MKKMFILIFIMLSLSIFSNWKTVELVDEFRDKTGQVSIVTDNDNLKEFLRIDKEISEKGEVSHKIYIDAYTYLGMSKVSETTSVSIRDDKGNTIYDLTGYITNNGNGFIMYDEDAEEVIDAIKRSKTLKIVAIKYNGDSVVLSFNVANFNLFENKLRVTGDKLEDKKNNTEKLVEKEFLIIGSVKKYDDALKLANDTKNKLGYSLDLRDLEEDKETGLSVNKELFSEYSIYVPRGFIDDEGKYISIEYTDKYSDFTKGYYIVVVSSGKVGSLKNELVKIKKLYKDAYIKKSFIN